MTLTINDTTMTSDQTAHTARHAPGRNGWEVSWLPGQTLDRNTAITAMILADTAAEPDLHEGHRLWPHIQSWAAELGLTGPEAIAAASQPPPDGIQPRRGTRRRAARPGGRRLSSQHQQHDRRIPSRHQRASIAERADRSAAVPARTRLPAARRRAAT